MYGTSIIMCIVTALTKFLPTPSAQNDYIPRGPFEITFPPGSRRQLYNVTIVDDTKSENSEFFNANVSLARPEDASRVTIGSPYQPLIEILDVDSE